MYDFREKRDEMCSVCLAIFARRGQPKVNENQYKEVVEFGTWTVAKETMDILVSRCLFFALYDLWFSAW